MNWKKLFRKVKAPLEQDIFGSPEFRIGKRRILVADPTAERYVAALKVLGNYGLQPVAHIESIEQYAVSVLEKAHAEELALETKLKDIVMQKSDELLSLYRAVFDLEGMDVTLEDVLKEPLWQIKLGVMIFFWRHKNHSRGQV